jgi:hypothetical protein
VWHLHLTCTESYWGDLCDGILGRPLHHRPGFGADGDDARHAAQHRATLASYRAWFGDEPPSAWWPGASAAAPVAATIAVVIAVCFVAAAVVGRALARRGARQGGGGGRGSGTSSDGSWMAAGIWADGSHDRDGGGHHGRGGDHDGGRHGDGDGGSSCGSSDSVGSSCGSSCGGGGSSCGGGGGD